MSDAMFYERSDFEISQGDKGVTYHFESKDRKVEANFFYEPGSVETRGLICQGTRTGIFHIVYPLLCPKGNYREPPEAEVILDSIILRLGRGEYELT